MLKPEGGASEVSKSIANYTSENNITTCVVGSHGYGAWQRSFMPLIGLGSVSLYCVHQLHCAVAVVKALETHELESDKATKAA